MGALIQAPMGALMRAINVHHLSSAPRLADVRRRGLSADAYPAWSTDGPIALGMLVDDERDRRSDAPVGSDAWLAMLATCGVEDLDRLLAGS